jgi:hypothetical protein
MKRKQRKDRHTDEFAEKLDSQCVLCCCRARMIDACNEQVVDNTHERRCVCVCVAPARTMSNMTHSFAMFTCVIDRARLF